MTVITSRVTAALGDDAVPAGFTAAAVTTAVRRALTRPTGWRDHDWRFIREEPQDPALHMALDEVLTPDTVTGAELHAAQRLARTKFASSEWTARLP